MRHTYLYFTIVRNTHSFYFLYLFRISPFESLIGLIILFQVSTTLTSAATAESSQKLTSSQDFESVKQFKFGTNSSNTITRGTMSKSRHVIQSVLSREQSEGVGARVRRSVGRQEVKYIGVVVGWFFFGGGGECEFWQINPHSDYLLFNFLRGTIIKHVKFCQLISQNINS